MGSGAASPSKNPMTSGGSKVVVPKCKRRVLTLASKLEIAEEMKKGKSMNDCHYMQLLLGKSA